MRSMNSCTISGVSSGISVYFLVLTNIIGQCVGAKWSDREKAYLRYSLKVGIFLLLVLSVVVVVFSRPLSGLFLKSEEIAEIVAGYFIIVSIGYVLNTVTNCFLGALNGLGKPTKSMLLMIFYYMIVRMPLAWFLNHMGLGLNGIWTAVLISHIVASIAAAVAGNKEIIQQEHLLKDTSMLC